MGRMKKRKIHGEEAMASSDRPKTKPKAKASVRDLDLEEKKDPDRSQADALKEGEQSQYLVACHWDWSRSSKPFSVYKVSPPASPKKRLKRLGRLETDPAGKAFTSVRRAWIVGVGGVHGDTVIFDTKTGQSIRGPNLKSAKWCPALMSVGDRVYAMSKSLSYVSDPDFPPWFEVLDLSQASVVAVGDHLELEGCSWSELPIPPCLPWRQPVIRYTNVKAISLMSYVVVGAYILVSFHQFFGTYAFDTNSDKWYKAHDEMLPFFGAAFRHGSIFLASSKRHGPINGYHIYVEEGTNSDNVDHDGRLKLSVTMIPLKFMERGVYIAGTCLSSLDNGQRFYSLSLSIDSHSITSNADNNECFPRKAHVNLTTYQTLEALDETLLAVTPEIAVSSKLEQTFKISSASHGFSPFAFTLLSA